MSTSYNLGLKVIRRLCEQQSALAWHKAKLSPELFKANEKPVFEWVAQHVTSHHALPHISTLEAKFPEIKELPTPEPPSYYITMLERGFYYQQINDANIKSQAILKADKDDYKSAVTLLSSAITTIKLQEYRTRIIDVAKEAPNELLIAYHNALTTEGSFEFGWPYMDSTGPVMPGDVVSFIGRPAMGKTWKMLYTAIHNWRTKKRNVLFVSMEMAPLPIIQRISTMYAHTNISQLKVGGYSSDTYKKFINGLVQMAAEEAKFYVVDGNLAASIDDVFMLADQLGCEGVWIDGAYLARHKNVRLDRFTRAAENVELMKRHTTDLQMVTFSSWQFNREASKKGKGKAGAKDEAGLEDIGYSDAIGQISSIVCAMFQDDGIETMKQRIIRVLKGRSGETGQFAIQWDFLKMVFDQVQEEQKGKLLFV